MPKDKRLLQADLEMKEAEEKGPVKNKKTADSEAKPKGIIIIFYMICCITFILYKNKGCYFSHLSLYPLCIGCYWTWKCAHTGQASTQPSTCEVGPGEPEKGDAGLSTLFYNLNHSRNTTCSMMQHSTSVRLARGLARAAAQDQKHSSLSCDKMDIYADLLICRM